MSRQPYTPVVATWLAFAAFAAAQPPTAIDATLEKTMKAAVAKVAPCVVQIQTAGGLDVIAPPPTTPGRPMPMNPIAALGIGAGLRTGEGPTSGVIVSPDGYVISSAFNFANKPTEVFVSVPGKRDRYVAKVIATDHSRMLTLLKIDATGLSVPQMTPKKEFKVGQYALALGRTWASADNPPSV